MGKLQGVGMHLKDGQLVNKERFSKILSRLIKEKKLRTVSTSRVFIDNQDRVVAAEKNGKLILLRDLVEYLEP